MQSYGSWADEGISLPHIYSAAFCRFCLVERRVETAFQSTTECHKCGKRMIAVKITVTPA